MSVFCINGLDHKTSDVREECGYCHDEEIARLTAENSRLRDAHKLIVTVLGPEAINCGCDGCHEEMSQALDAAKEALASPPKEEKP